MVTRVSCYKTIDGELFEDFNEAVKYENVISNFNDKLMGILYTTIHDDINFGDESTTDMLETIYKDIIKSLYKYRDDIVQYINNMEE